MKIFKECEMMMQHKSLKAEWVSVQMVMSPGPQFMAACR